jgi:hypothetical protein
MLLLYTVRIDEAKILELSTEQLHFFFTVEPRRIVPVRSHNEGPFDAA